jgi:hypothetical protein
MFVSLLARNLSLLEIVCKALPAPTFVKVRCFRASKAKA